MLTMEETFIVTGLAVLIVGTALGVLGWWIQENECNGERRNNGEEN